MQKKRSVARENDSRLDDKLLENIIKLEKIHTDMAEKFDKLAKEISSLLALFELTAKNFSKQQPARVMEGDKEFLDKIDRLVEQNKTIAKGLTLLEEHMRRKIYSPSHVPGAEQEEQGESQIRTNRPLPRF